MSLRGIVVCVGYADLFARSIECWHTGLDRLVVVTAPKDTATQVLCERLGVEHHVTDIFYANGAQFNKFAALSEAAIKTRWREDADWLLSFDADIVPPLHWRDSLSEMVLTPGNLYGAYRYWQAEDASPLIVDMKRKMPQSWVLGFFSMFYATDSALPPSGPLWDLHWPHSGNGDTVFSRRWPRERHHILPIPMIHLGEERMHWCGRGKEDELKAILAKRHGHEDWEREKMANPPILET